MVENIATNKEWPKEVVELLNRVRVNSVALSEYHRRRFYYYKGFSKYFDLPILVLSIFGSSFSVGTQNYLSQGMISGISCLVGVVVSIITSIKLYLNVDTSMQNELKMSKEFYTLSIDIYRMLCLNCKERGENGNAYLQKVYGNYMKLMEGSHLLTRRFKSDQLTPADEDVFLGSFTSTPTQGADTPPQRVRAPSSLTIPPIIFRHPSGTVESGLELAGSKTRSLSYADQGEDEEEISGESDL